MKSNRVLKALTGLKIKQFMMLAVLFEFNLRESFEKYRNVSLDLRKFILESAKEKLFFILFLTTMLYWRFYC